MRNTLLESCKKRGSSDIDSLSICLYIYSFTNGEITISYHGSVIYLNPKAKQFLKKVHGPEK
jgi:hypothetical protein